MSRFLVAPVPVAALLTLLALPLRADETISGDEDAARSSEPSPSQGGVYWTHRPDPSCRNSTVCVCIEPECEECEKCAKCDEPELDVDGAAGDAAGSAAGAGPGSGGPGSGGPGSG
ncbi:MAG: hypothetical protein AAF664_26165, partial [Planctomycetota bacterium]